MKRLRGLTACLLATLALASVSGCVAVPVDPGQVYAVPAQPAVIYVPNVYYPSGAWLYGGSRYYPRNSYGRYYRSR